MERQNLVRRLLYLRNWEFFNIFFLPACLWFILRTLQIQNWFPYAVGMALICFILMQGMVYWHLKLQTVRDGKPLPSHFRRWFLLFRRLDAFLLCGYVLLALLGMALPALGFRISLGAVLVFVFAVLEFVNYYFYQLSGFGA